jgi:elongation factor Ts
MGIDAKLVVQLRSMTGAGMMDAKKALVEAEGDLEKAAEILRKKGAAKAEKRAERKTSEGRVAVYHHATGKLAATVEVLCETDFVAKNENFQAFASDIAMHIGACAPEYLSRESVPEDVVENQLKMFREELESQNKPEEVIEKILEGKLNKWYSEIVLLEQSYIKDEDKTIDEYLKEQIATIGENMQIRGFSRFQI